MATSKDTVFPYLMYKIHPEVNKAYFAVLVLSPDSWEVYGMNGKMDPYWGLKYSESDFADPRVAVRNLQGNSQQVDIIKVIENVTDREKTVIFNDMEEAKKLLLKQNNK